MVLFAIVMACKPSSNEAQDDGEPVLKTHQPGHIDDGYPPNKLASDSITSVFRYGLVTAAGGEKYVFMNIDSTGVPLPFNVGATIYFEKPKGNRKVYYQGSCYQVVAPIALVDNHYKCK